MSELKYLIDKEGQAPSLSLSEDNDRGGSPGFLSQQIKINSDYHYTETLTYLDIEISKQEEGLPEIIRITDDNTDDISTTFTVFGSQIQKSQTYASGTIIPSMITCICYKDSIPTEPYGRTCLLPSWKPGKRNKKYRCVEESVKVVYFITISYNNQMTIFVLIQGRINKDLYHIRTS